MKVITAFNVISKQVTKRGNEIAKLEFDINAGAAATVYVQLHDFPSVSDLAAGLTAPAPGSVPIKSWPTPQGAQDNYKEFKSGEVTFNNGVFACVSTTQATLTIGTGNNKFDSLSAEVINEVVVGTTEVQASNANSLQIFSEATGAASVLKLLRVAATNLDGVKRYLMLFAVDAPSSGVDIPIETWTLQASGDGAGRDSILLDFTPFGGVVVESQTAAHVPKRGATVYGSILPNVFSPIADSSFDIYGEYK